MNLVTRPGSFTDQLIEIFSTSNPEKIAQVEEIIQLDRGKESSLRDALVKAGIGTEAQVQRAVAQVLGVPFSPHLPEVPPALIESFTENVGIRLAKLWVCFPLRLDQEVLELAVFDLWPRQGFEEVAKALGAHGVELVLCPKDEILSFINKHFDKSQSSAEEAAEVLEDDQDLNYLKEWTQEETEDLLDAEDEEPIKRLMNSILFQSVKENSSDIHIDPGFKETQVRYRIDGVLRPITKVPRQGHVPLINRVKVMAGLDISAKNKPQDGRSMILLAGKKIDIRVSIIPTIHGEQAVLRLLNQSQGIIELSKLGFQPAMADQLEQLVCRPHGILLVTGPTGSGKTTTLYSLLNRIDAKEKNIVTIEDPVEYRIGDYGQMQVSEKTGVTFAKGLRAMLRQDPDVIMVGEMRDSETAQIAIQASLTGHLVLSTLHTNDAPSSIVRLIDMGIEPFLVSSTLTGIIAQRLVRVLCPSCKRQESIEADQLITMGFNESWLEHFSGHIWHPVGCPACQDSGYKGRLGVYELLMVDDDVRKAIASGQDAVTIRQLAVKGGMLELGYDCAQKVMQGQTSVEEMLRITSHLKSEP